MRQILSGIIKEDFACNIDDKKYSLVTYSGSSTILVFIVSADKCIPIGRVSIARSAGDQMIRKEYNMLSYVMKNSCENFKDSVPTPIRLRNINGKYIMTSSFVEGQRICFSKRNIKKTREYLGKIKDWLILLHNIAAPASQEKKSRFAEARQRILGISENIKLDSDMQGIIDIIKDYQVLEGLPAIINHRDILSNILVYNNSIRIIDWGHSNFGYPLIDWVRFLCRFLMQIYKSGDILSVLKIAFLKESGVTKLIYSETKDFLKAINLKKDFIAPVFLLSLFGFLESFYFITRNEPYTEKAKFLVSESKWLGQLIY